MAELGQVAPRFDPFIENTMKSILPLTRTLIASAVAVTACVDTSTSTCADGARCPTGDLCVEQPNGPVCAPAARVHACADKNEGEPCRYDEMSSPALCRAGICTLMECGNGYEDWGEICDDGNLVDADGCSRDCQRHCGDGIVQKHEGELCDVTVPLTASCMDRGFDMGTLTCAASCQDESTMSCIDFDWQPMQTVPDGWHVLDVWVFSPELAVAVGMRGASPRSLDELLMCDDCGGIFEYDGTSWTLIQDSLPTLLDLWATAPDDIYAVGVLGNISHYDGSVWTSMPVDPGYHLATIWGTGPDNLFAVGTHRQPGRAWDTIRFAILRYDGSAWTPMLLPDDGKSSSPGFNALFSIWGSGTDNVFAVGFYGTILHYDGNPDGTWTRMDVPPDSSENLLDVWGTQATNVNVVGANGTILHYDGGGWSRMDSPTERDLIGIWSTQGGQMFAVGVDGTLLGYDPLAGGEWRTLVSGTSLDLIAIHGTTADNVLAVGLDGTVVRRGQSAWTTMDLPGNQNSVTQIWGSGLDCMLAVGMGGQIWRYDGNESWRWALVDAPENGQPWRDVHGLGCDESIFVVGTAQPALRHRDGTWKEMPETASLDLKSVWASGRDAVFAVGRDGTILRHDGNPELRWERMDSGVTTLLKGVWGTSPRDVFAVGLEGLILHYDGNPDGTWTRMDSGVNWMLNDLWGTAPNNVFAVGEETTILHYDGASWTRMEIPAAVGILQAVWGSSAQHVFTASDQGVLFHYDGANWSEMRSPTDVDISSIWGTPDGKHIFVADDLGRIHRLTLPPAALPAD